MSDIFVIEDDGKLREELKTLLERNGHSVRCVGEYGSAVDEVLAAAPDAVILDLTLPGIDGQVVCRGVREESTVPVLVLTSRDNELDELISLSRGADDFIAKPFSPPILLARLSALLRRSAVASADDVVSCAGVTLDMARASVAYDGIVADLTRNELQLLYLLMNRAGSIVSRSDLQNELWQSDAFVDDNTLTVNIARLRATLSGIGVPDDYLQTRRGLGYVIEG